MHYNGWLGMMHYSNTIVGVGPLGTMLMQGVVRHGTARTQHASTRRE